MFQAIGQFIVSASLALAGLFGYHQPLLAGSAIYIPAPRYESSLAQSMSATQTSTMYLVSGVDGNGETLTGNMCFTIDAGVANTVEDVCGNASGTQVSNLIRGVDTSGFNASTTLAHAHRVGADVKITDSPYLAQYSAFLNGSQGLPNPLIYNASNTPAVVGANILNIASVGYVNSTSFNGAPDGSITVKGIYQEATGAQIASGTTSGSTGADLALTTNVTATSSKANSVVTTNASGTLDPSFVSGTAYTFTNPTINATGTFNGNLTLSNVTSSLLMTNASGTIGKLSGNYATGTLVAFNNGTWQAGISQIFATSSVVMTTTTQMNVATITLPLATANSIYEFTIQYSVGNSGIGGTTSTISINSSGSSFQLMNCNTGGSGNPFSGFIYGRILMINSTSTEMVFSDKSSFSSSGNCTASTNSLGVQNLNFATTTTINISTTNQSATAQTTNSTTTVSLIQ